MSDSSSDEEWGANDFADEDQEEQEVHTNFDDWGDESTPDRSLALEEQQFHTSSQRECPVSRGEPSSLEQMQRVQEPIGHFMEGMHGRGTSHVGPDVEWKPIGEPNWPSNVEEDLPILSQLGLNIDYSTSGKLGKGGYGTVFLGSMERENSKQPFAVKIIDFKQVLQMTTTSYPSSGPPKLTTPPTGASDEIREMTETEKFIVTNTDHPNVVSVLMIINMGEPKIHTFKGAPTNTFVSTPRVYIFMELADGGSLAMWLPGNRDMEPSLRISLIRDLFRGMKYLHDKNIVHGDVHNKNVLLFNPGSKLTAKWADFGSGFVSERGQQYVFKRPISANKFNEELAKDIFRLAFVLTDVLDMRDTGPSETPKEKQTLDELKRMAHEIPYHRQRDINKIYDNFRNVLDDNQQN